MLAHLPLVFDSGQFFDDFTQLLWAVCAETRHYSIEQAICSLGRSRPAADATREVVERWLLHGCDVSVGHRRVSYLGTILLDR
jgi:hypothetical protein